MRNLDLFPPLPTLPRGSESIQINSAERLKAMQRKLEQSKPRPRRSQAQTKAMIRAALKATMK